MLRFARSAGLAAVTTAACVTATGPAPGAGVESRAAPQPTASAGPDVVECTHQHGPARPLYPAEVFAPFCRGDSIELQHRRIPSLNQRLADERDPARRLELATWLADDHLMLFEHGVLELCASERDQGPAAAPDRSELHAHLHAAMVVGAEALELARELGVEATSELLCLHTISASRLGELESARVSAAALGSEADCTGSALVEYGLACDREGSHEEARATFERALAIAQAQPELDVTCPVAGPERALAEVSRCPRPSLFRRWCAWQSYLRYRLVWSAHALGELDAAQAADALAELATALRGRSSLGGETLLAAIDDDRRLLIEGESR